MKKYVLFFTTIFTQFSLNAQTEYIDISKIGMLKTSTMAIYNDDVNYNDLEVFRLNIFSNPKHYHWVKYTNIGKNKIILTLSDDEGDVREICTKENDKKAECKIFDSFSTSYEYSSNAKIFQIWISRPNPNIDENKLVAN
jgi:hypothetical protein